MQDMPETMPAQKSQAQRLLESAFARRNMISPILNFVKPKNIPLPFRRLLVHDSDMTSTLKRHHREDLILKLINVKRVDSCLDREVVLCKERDGKPVEYGVIRIWLGQLSSAARAAVLLGRRPLGQILDEFHIVYESHPRDFFCIQHADYLQTQLQDGATKERFGRINSLHSKQGELAEVLEILPVLKSDC